MLVRVDKDEHGAPMLHAFHSLPIKLHVHFKVLLYTYKGLNEHAPAYMCDMLEIYKLGKPLRSGSQCMLAQEI